MAFDILSFAMGKAAAGNSGGGSAKKIIFSEQTLGFSYSEGYGAYVYAITDSIPFTLVDGKEYNVVWDGDIFARTAFAYTNPADGSNCVAVGNTLVTGGENNGDIFAVVCDITNGFTYFFSLETTASHTVEIYQGEEQFTGVETSVDLDFSAGDMEVTPNEGEAFSKVTIPQPDTLVAGNIAEGVTVAGILGTLASGGSFNKMYFENDGMGFPNKYMKQLYSYNGDMYCVTDMGSKAAGVAIYKYENGSWTQQSVLTDTSQTYYTQMKGFWEYNGKIHARYAQNHFGIENGTTLIKYNEFPSSFAYLFENNGKLYCQDSYKLYVWDEDSDTWTVEVDRMNESSVDNLVQTADGKTYSLMYGKIYVFENNSWVDIGVTLTNSTSSPAIAMGNKIYFSSSGVNGQQKLCCFDLDTMTETIEGYLPTRDGYISFRFAEDSGKIRHYYYAEGYRINMLIHLPE